MDPNWDEKIVIIADLLTDINSVHLSSAPCQGLGLNVPRTRKIHFSIIIIVDNSVDYKYSQRHPENVEELITKRRKNVRQKHQIIRD